MLFECDEKCNQSRYYFDHVDPSSRYHLLRLQFMIRYSALAVWRLNLFLAYYCMNLQRILARIGESLEEFLDFLRLYLTILI